MLVVAAVGEIRSYPDCVVVAVVARDRRAVVYTMMVVVVVVLRLQVAAELYSQDA